MPVFRRHKRPSLPPPLKDLDDAEWRLALSLARDRDPRAVPELLSYLGSEGKRGRQARKALDRIGDGAIPVLIVALAHPDRFDSGAVQDELVRLAPESVEPLLGALKGNATRMPAAQALAKTRDPRAVPALIEMATSGTRDERQLGVWALGRHSSPDGYDVIAGALRDRCGKMRNTAAWSLGELGDARAVEPLIATLGDQEGDVRGSAIRALGTLGDARAIAPLVELLREQADNAIGDSYTCANAIRDCGGQQTLADLVSNDPDVKVRLWAVMGLSHHPRNAVAPTAAVIPALIEALASDDDELVNCAGAALRALEEVATAPCGGHPAAEAVLPLLDDPRAKVRESAVFAIWTDNSEEVGKKLMELARRDPDEKVRRQAAWGLGLRWRPNACETLLEVAAYDESEEVTQVAKKSIEWLRREENERARA